MSNIQEVIGDYATFVKTVLQKAREAGFNPAHYPIDHLCFRVKSLDDYFIYKGKLLSYAKEYVENVHHGRPIIKIVLMEPLIVDEYKIPLIELPAPKSNVEYVNGLEHLELAVGDDYSLLKEKYSNTFTGEEDSGPYNKPLLINLDDGKTLKIHQHSLYEVLTLEKATFVLV